MNEDTALAFWVIVCFNWTAYEIAGLAFIAEAMDPEPVDPSIGA